MRSVSPNLSPFQKFYRTAMVFFVMFCGKKNITKTIALLYRTYHETSSYELKSDVSYQVYEHSGNV